jgi:serine/threonine protein kinase
MAGASKEANSATLRSELAVAEHTLEFAPGQELMGGRFRVERVLGRGGMGLVYAVRDRARGETVAIKTLQLAREPTAIQSIKREFRALMDLAHPNLVRLHELFLDDEHCFFSMDLIEGVNFSSYVRPNGGGVHFESSLAVAATTVRSAGSEAPSSQSRPAAVRATAVDLERLRPALRQLVLGVDALHRAGKLHRDLKPSNVLVTSSGRVLILDFGLVQDERASLDAAQRGELSGTPLYMAPELFAGQPPSPASDWFSVGVMLYQALSASEPFSAHSRLARAFGEAPRAPSDIADGVPPELESLCLALLQHNPSERPDASRILRSVGAESSASAPPRAGADGTAQLVGRDRQSEGLHAAFDDCARTRKPVVVFLAGVSGVGKTSLLEHFAHALRPSVKVVLLGRCYERESVPHKAFDEVMDALTRELERRSPEARAALLPDQCGPLAQLFPILRQIPEIATRFAEESDALEARELRRRGYGALAELLARLAGGDPLVIGIDDLHWGDLDSARLLTELLTQDGAPPCLVIASYRSEEAGSSACLARLLHGEPPLSALADVRHIDVTELGPEEARALAASLLDPAMLSSAERLEAVCNEARGNPLLLQELASHDPYADTPQLDLRAVVRARVARLNDGERRLFEFLCVAGQPLSQAVVSTALGAPEDISSAISNLRAERLLRERTSLRPDALDVFHDRIRGAALSELNQQVETARHRDLAQAYERAEPEAYDALARHHAGAGERGRAAHFAELAADAAGKALAFNRAVDLYRQALEHAPPSLERARALRLKLAIALSDAGRGREAAPLFLKAAAHANARLALEYRRRAAEQWLVSGELELGLQALEAVLSAVKLRLPRTPRAALFDLLLTRLRLGLRGLEFRARAEDEVAPRQLLRIDACKASWALGFVNTIQGAAFQARFLEQALRAGEPSRIALGLGMEAIYASAEGGKREPRVNRLRMIARKLSETLSNPQLLAFDKMVEGQSSYMFGRWQRCTEALEAAEKLLVERCRGVTWELNSSRFFWGNALIYQGRWREVARRTQTWLDDAADRGDGYASSSLHMLRTRCLTLAADDPSRALREIDAALAEWRSPDYGVHRFLADCSRIQVALYSGDAAHAVRLVTELWPAFKRSLMSRTQIGRIHSYHHSAYALLALAAESPANQALLAQVARYVHKLDAERMPWADAFSQYLQAASARLSGDLERAARGLSGAAAAFENCRMVFYAASSRARLGALLGNEGGRIMIHESEACMRAQGVLRPERVFAMMAPGFGSPRSLPAP